ncbi:MAG: LysE family translocator [Kiritimatiellia bacterium]
MGRRHVAFFLTALVLAAAPGPDILFVLVQSLTHGWRAGSLVTLGLCTGIGLHVTLAAFGVAAVLSRHPRWFTAVTWCGAAYLVWLGVGAWKSASSVAFAGAAEAALSPLRLYLRGIVMNALNPKVMLFFLALMPRFVVPERGRVALQFLMLGAIFALATLLVFHGVAFGGGGIAGLLARHAESACVLQRFAALVMFALAGWIGWTNVRGETCARQPGG